MSAIDEVIRYAADNATIDAGIYPSVARAELAALRDSERSWQAQAEIERANAAEQRERAEQLRVTVEAQARQLTEAREIIAHYEECPTGGNCGMRDIARDWLAANAPAPQAEQAQTTPD